MDTSLNKSTAEATQWEEDGMSSEIERREQAGGTAGRKVKTMRGKVLEECGVAACVCVLGPLTVAEADGDTTE